MQPQICRLELHYFKRLFNTLLDKFEKIRIFFVTDLQVSEHTQSLISN